ncbi:hypothetical protein V5O48_003954 [Marasmius crinis-equi]|uniref:Uncharacterized protein n=1 Tax=Marasmius crinis-equi TaxID=585013 RepID=A0ABR3FRZ8_9AGAR
MATTSNNNNWGNSDTWQTPPASNTGWGDLKPQEAATASNAPALPPPSVPASSPDSKNAKIAAAEEAWTNYYQRQPASLVAIPWRPRWDSLTRDPPRYSRGDMMDIDWSWNGSPDRDTILDGLPNEVWGPTQLHRCLPTARKQDCPPPTFTGAQVMDRLRGVEEEFAAIDVELEKAHRERRELEERAQELDREATECWNKSRSLDEKVEGLDSKRRLVNEVMQDLKDLQAIGLCFARA